MNVFRGYKNIKPSDINHRFISNGFYGPAIYLALSFEDAERYAADTNNSRRKVIIEYELNDSKLLNLTNSDIFNLEKFSIDNNSALDKELKLSEQTQEILTSNKNIDPTTLAATAFNSGYSGIRLTGKVEGGEQIIIPKESDTTINKIATHVGLWFFNDSIKEKFQEAIEQILNSKLKKQYGYYWFSYSSEKDQIINELLDFHESLGFDISKVNYLHKTVEYYEED
jgi:hypothetical protein